MPQTTIAGRTLDVNEEGFLTEFDQWDEDLSHELAKFAGIDELTDEHLAVVTFLRRDFQTSGETATLRRTSKVGGFEVQDLYRLFPGKPAKKMAYVAGLPKPKGCV